MTEQQRTVLGLLSSTEGVGEVEIVHAYRDLVMAETGTTPSGVYQKVRRLLFILRDREEVVVDYRGKYWLAPKAEEVARRAKAAPKKKKPKYPIRTRVQLPKKKIRRQSFSQKYDGTGEKYGQLFLIVRVLKCDLLVMGYTGLGHPQCQRGVQGTGGHTAHHVCQQIDALGLLPGCGAGHDLYAGLGGRKVRLAFTTWCKANGYDIIQRGLVYVAQARGIVDAGVTAGVIPDNDLRW